jgi:hypothetical protein
VAIELPDEKKVMLDDTMTNKETENISRKLTRPG